MGQELCLALAIQKSFRLQGAHSLVQLVETDVGKKEPHTFGKECSK